MRRLRDNGEIGDFGLLDPTIVLLCKLYDGLGSQDLREGVADGTVRRIPESAGVDQSFAGF